MAKLSFVRVCQLEVEYEVDDAKLARFKSLDKSQTLSNEAQEERGALWRELYEKGYDALFTSGGRLRRNAGWSMDPITSQVWELVDGDSAEEPLLDVDH